MKTENQTKSSTRSRYWEAIFYPDSCVLSWAEDLPDIIQVPCCWILHDRDHLGAKYGPIADRDRLAHVHLIMAFDGPTTENNVKRIVNLLAPQGGICCPCVLPVNYMRGAYQYLTHSTDAAQKAGKYQYAASDIHLCNNFDIDIYVAISQAQKDLKTKELIDIIIMHRFTNFYDFLVNWVYHQNDPEGLYMDAVMSRSGLLERVMRGVYLHDHPESSK